MLVNTKNERKCNLSLALNSEISIVFLAIGIIIFYFMLKRSSTQRRRRFASLLVSSSSTAFFR